MTVPYNDTITSFLYFTLSSDGQLSLATYYILRSRTLSVLCVTYYERISFSVRKKQRIVLSNNKEFQEHQPTRVDRPKRTLERVEHHSSKKEKNTLRTRFYRRCQLLITNPNRERGWERHVGKVHSMKCRTVRVSSTWKVYRLLKEIRFCCFWIFVKFSKKILSTLSITRE